MERYAVYFAPRPGGALADFGMCWLGWDAERGVPAPRAYTGGFTDKEFDAFTASPLRYGFHGTLKPPFRLAEGATYDEFRDAVSVFATRMAAIELGQFKLKRLGGFLALVPAERSPALQGLAGRCVKALDRFRAPASAGEKARRRKAGLSPRQDAYLLQWGYPYVLKEFRFHLTLTGSLEERDLVRMEDHLSGLLAPVLREPVTLSDLCLFGDPGRGEPCRIVERIPLPAG